MKAGTGGMKAGGRRIKLGRNSRGGRKRDRNALQEPEIPEKRSIGLYWYLLGFSILLVAGLSFVNFLALPDLHSPLTLHLPQLRGGMKVVSTDGYVDGGVDEQLSARSPRTGIPAAMSESPFRSMYEQGASSAANALTITPPAARPQRVTQERLRQLVDQGTAAAYEADAREAAARAMQATGQANVAPRSPEPQRPAPSAHARQVAGGGGVAVLNGDSWLKLSKNVDAREITFGAWIFLPNAPVSAFPQSSLSMKTVAATKISGCKIEGESSDGWALFVHEWGTFNQQLRFSWTDRRLACNELYSETALVPFDRWVLVGFSLSEARNQARLVIDGKVVADTKIGMGSLAKASQRVPLNEASIRERKLQGADGSLMYGAHKPQMGDSPHVQSHIFFGFLGDMRVVHTSPEEDAALQQVLMASAEDVLSQGHATASAIIVQTQFKASREASFGQQLGQNLADAQPLTRQPDNGKPFEVVPFSELPRHPWYQNRIGHNPDVAVDMGTQSQNEGPVVPLVALATLTPASLQATWPMVWVEKFGEAGLTASQNRANVWAEEIREAMAHTWRGYKAKAWGHDDLKPLSGRPKDWCRLGITILDSLTTLWLMGLTEQFDQATQWLKDNPLPSPGGHGLHSGFEITIRGLGGLLGAYALSGQQIFLDNAHRLGDALLHAYNTPSGMPKAQVDVGSGATKWHGWVNFAVLAEVATTQVEMRYLSHVIGDDTYKRAADKSFNAVLATAGERGIIPLYLTTNDAAPRFGNRKISMGAMGDSYYEYLIKQWVQTGKTEDRFKNKWKVAMNEMIDQLVRKTEGGLTYVCEKDNSGGLRHRMDHLACFVAGMLMMGANEMHAEEVDPRWVPTAAAITETCHEMYKRSPSGLSPEYVVFHPERGAGNDMSIPNDAPHNMLRPEAAEAMYYMHYYTGDPKYRDWAHEMFQAFERHSKARYGYSSVRDVRQNPPMKRDDMESFWAAETLKYLYLIMAPRSKFSMDDFVLNTEAHPVHRWVE